MEKTHELIIIGSGAAGLTAGIYAGRALIDTVIIEKLPVSGGQIVKTHEIDNYPGLPRISGIDLGMKLREHSEQFDLEFITGEVIKFEVKDGIKELTLEDGQKYYSKTVLIATGADPRKLGVKGEEELQGMGVSYCATCDGAFFRNQAVAIVGGGDVAVEDSLFLARLCEKVYLIHRRDEFRATKSYVEKMKATPNIEMVLDSQVEEIIGEDQVETVLVKNKKTNERKELKVNAVFIAIGNIPNSNVYQASVDVDEGGYIVADEDGKTNIPGVFVAGDIRTKELRQIITAASDGANVVTTVEKYLNSLES